VLTNSKKILNFCLKKKAIRSFQYFELHFDGVFIYQKTPAQLFGFGLNE